MFFTCRCRTLVKEIDSEHYLTRIHVSLWIVVSWLVPPLLCIGTYFISLRAYVLMVSSVFMITLLVVSVSYVVIMRTVWSAKRLLALSNNFCHKTHARFKIGRRVALFIGFYVLCFSPMVIMLVTNLYYLMTEKQRPAGFQIFFMSADFLACVNSCVNPWVYTMKMNRLRHKMRRGRRKKELMNKYAVRIR